MKMNKNFEIKDGKLIKVNSDAENVVLPKEVKSIAKGVFSKCENLKRVALRRE